MQPLVATVLALQVLVVLFIALNDWLPLPPLNDVKAAQAADGRPKLLLVTFLSTLPFAVGLGASWYYARSGFPNWLWWLLWISYGVGLYGMLRAWWIPYLFRAEPARAGRYQMFARTHAFLPLRNGLRPNTFHVAFHVVFVATIVSLVLLRLR